MLQVNDHPSGGRSHLCNADRHAKYKIEKEEKRKNTGINYIAGQIRIFQFETHF